MRKNSVHVFVWIYVVLIFLIPSCEEHIIMTPCISIWSSTRTNSNNVNVQLHDLLTTHSSDKERYLDAAEARRNENDFFMTSPECTTVKSLGTYGGVRIYGSWFTGVQDKYDPYERSY